MHKVTLRPLLRTDLIGSAMSLAVFAIGVAELRGLIELHAVLQKTRVRQRGR
jgi:hypothetical protein